MKSSFYFRLFVFLNLVTSLPSFSQKGKNGNVTISTTTINIKVNEFTTLTANNTTNSKTITVANSSLNTNSRFTSTLQVGDLLMIMQMQGAIIKTFTTVPGQDSTYGQILNYNNAGNYEFAQVFAIPNSTTIVLDCGLTNTYIATGKVQVIRVPRYNSLTVNAGVTIDTDPWNGTTGGVVAFEVAGITTINGTVTATGLGFRGGAAINNGGVGGSRCVDLGGGANEGGEKGESIVGAAADYLALYGGQYAKGAPANGGGGGDSHNAGGGGGANAGNINGWFGHGMINPTYTLAYSLEFLNRHTISSSGGGKGGYCFSSANLNPNVVGPSTGSWGGDSRRNQGGFGGRPLDYSTGKLFFGGGGGAGHVNNLGGGNTGGTGGAGGGLIFIQSYGNINGNGLIVSNGAAGTTATGPNPGVFSSNVNGNDGAGGGGGGGTILLATDGTVASLSVTANGGRGGNQTIVKGGFAGANTEAEGPGGGGGGGYIAYSLGTPVQSVLGAVSGTTNSNPMANFPPNGASNGANGLQDQNIKLYIINTFNATVCVNSAATVSATTNNPSLSIVWYNSIVGATQIGTGTVFTSSVFTTPGTYTVYAGNCPGTYREPAIITVVATPTLSAPSATICGSQSVTLTASGATTYTWSTGSNSSTTAVTPTATTIYTVSGSTNGCIGQSTVSVLLQALPSFTLIPSSTIICTNQTITINSSGSAGTYSWNTGATTPSINVTTFGIYTATLTNGCGTVVNTVNIQDGPASGVALSASDNTICPGGTVTLTASGTGTFAWSTTTLNVPSVTVSTSGIYFVTITNICGTSNASIQVTNGPQPTINVVPAASVFCSGQTAMYTALGSATSYTWSNGNTTPTFTTTSAGNFSVVATNSCGTTNSVFTVTFQSSPDISVSSNKSVLCPIDAAVLTATNLSGGGNFLWSSSANTSSIEPITAGGIYTVSYTNNCGIQTVTIAVAQSTLVPNFAFTPSTGIAPLSVNFTNMSFNNFSNQWDFGNGLTAVSADGSTTYGSPGIYTISLSIQNADGCASVITKTIEVVKQPFGIVPQLLSPNGDGKNDKFEIIGIESFTNSDLQIFNRWGNLVYSMKNYQNTFDGTPNYKGNSEGKLPVGTYFYILKLGDSSETIFKGFVELVY